ncbi:hypothetical protein [Acinetobacter lactucae]|uniref:hypothetical protein n=1 Tax=Acinetobacter lactucae TaxID=1785128 RepID=UPI001580D16A|nr:hypothetical protein [Acinetobacter lactucae]NUF17184.1 hypothetical protein [Acinetobacter lactucae]
MKDLQKIYADKVNEALFRLNKCEALINSYFEIRDVLDLESLIVKKSISSIRELLKLYFTVIRTPEFTGVWVLETRDNIVQFLIGDSKGEFLVEDY